MDATLDAASKARLEAVAALYHAYFTGLIMTLATRRPPGDAALWIEALFRHQHEQKFLSSFDKLGLGTMPHAPACAAYHYLSNRVGGVDVEYMAESDRKAWVRFPPPRWVFDGTAICAIPTDVSRGMLRGWYARNGISLQNPRLGFVCTSQTVDGQHGLSGYFLEFDHDLANDERLRFRPGEQPPPYDPDKAPRLPEGNWPPDRLIKAKRNYAIEYIRSGLPRLAELFGPVDAAFLGRITGRLIGAQFYRLTAQTLSIPPGGASGFATFMAALAQAEGDCVTIEQAPTSVTVSRNGWRLANGWGVQPPELFEAWNGLWEGALMAHDRHLRLAVISREDLGDDATRWAIGNA
ncbi:MAG: hypothetical protein KKB37_10905 [Alphaproteobacteria bacterium]|nr:hypothetical protein [Alphaproteobacteria bacterium]